MSIGWTPAINRGIFTPMPTVKLDDDELATAAQGFRNFVRIAIEDSKKQTSTQFKLMFMESAQRHQDTAEKLERARKGGSQGAP